ncbi:clarin-3 [Pelobates cultripes]|uniref:Clarin-3 n=1 Tax=Pelobates cultripes TaxID=61616 RepID=A0AAD1TFV4_PELCU|nr:clarin-3 [Pelobates cultripes]
MPSKQKTLLFFSGFVLSIGSFAIICTSLGTQSWVSSKVNFDKSNGSGYALLSYGLFQVRHEKIDNGGLDTQLVIHQVLQLLKPGDSQHIIQILVILILVVGLLCSFLGSATTCLNSVSNPYLTFLGPLGVYIWASINGFAVLLAMVLFASNTEANQMPKYLAQVLDQSTDQYHKSENTYGYSYWLLLPCIFLNIATIGVIYYYQHARYNKKKEQERPMENASKDVILF